ncbi:hypothetical protein SD369_11000 [Bacteroides fragilis]
MKKIILLIIASCTVAMATAQKKEQFTFATSVGTGIDMSEPAATPFSLQVLGYMPSTNGSLSVSGQDYLFMRKF